MGANRSQPANPRGPAAFLLTMYVYGVIRAKSGLRLPREGIRGRRVDCVGHEGVAALVTDVGEGPFEPSHEDAVAHACVLHEIVARSIEVLPLPVGVVFEDRDAVCDELLGARQDELVTRLDELAGRVELEVTARDAQTIARVREVVGDLVDADARDEDDDATLAFLLDRHRVPAFDTALEEAFGADLPRCAGPQPPYHFAALAG